MDRPQTPDHPEGFDIVANMKARVETAKADKNRQVDEPAPQDESVDIVALMRERCGLGE